MRKPETAWMIMGSLSAAASLAVASIWLLSPPETSAKVLVAVWLWALPILGTGAFMGWLIARVVRKLGSGR
jgi:hypothetical protein